MKFVYGCILTGLRHIYSFVTNEKLDRGSRIVKRIEVKGAYVFLKLLPAQSGGRDKYVRATNRNG